MYAIVDIAGQQLKVEKDKKVYINRIKGEVGSKIDLNKVLFIDNEKEKKIGTPYIKDASVTGKIISHIKDKKVKIFKKKRRKGYKVLNSHRQYLTELLIEEITETKAARGVAKEKEQAQKITKEKHAETRTSAMDTAKKETKVKKAATKKPLTGPAAKAKKKTAKKGNVSKSLADKKPAVKAKSQVNKTSKDKKQTRTN